MNLALQTALGLALPALETWLAWVLWRCGAVGLFPAFFVFTVLSGATQCLFAAHLYNACLHATIALTPLKAWACYEAIALRLVLVRYGTPTKVLGEHPWLMITGAGVAIMLISAASLLPIQFNVPQAAGKIRTLSELALAAILGVACLYAHFRPPKSPRRAKEHLALLFWWFAATTPNLFAVGKGEAELWGWISVGGMIVKAGLLVGWLWLFRFREPRHRLESAHLLSDSR